MYIFYYADKIKILSHQCKSLTNESCLKLLRQLLHKASCKIPLLKFLMLETWELKKFDCSSIRLNTLLVDKRITSPKLLERFLELGTQVTQDGILCAIKCLSSDDIMAFKLIASKCARFDVDLMCREAANLKKIAFVLHFVELGAKHLEEGTNFFKAALRVKDFDGAKVLIKLFTKETLESLDLGVFLDTTNLIMDIELIANLIEKLTGAGIPLTGKKPPIAAVVGSRLISVMEQIEVVCILLDHGVDCKQLCLTTHKSTTPLHEATEMALNSGEFV